MFAEWINQDTLIAWDAREGNIRTFDLKTQKWNDFAPGVLADDVVYWNLSPDGKYLYYTTRGAEPKAMRIRLADHRVEAIASLKELHRAGDTGFYFAPDGSPIFTRDTGYQEIYALNIRWP